MSHTMPEARKPSNTIIIHQGIELKASKLKGVSGVFGKKNELKALRNIPTQVGMHIIQENSSPS